MRQLSVTVKWNEPTERDWFKYSRFIFQPGYYYLENSYHQYSSFPPCLASVINMCLMASNYAVVANVTAA